MEVATSGTNNTVTLSRKEVKGRVDWTLLELTLCDAINFVELNKKCASFV